VGWVRVARIFSNIISPPVIFALLGLALAMASLPFWQALWWAAVFGFWISLAPILLVAYMLRTGRISDLHMSSRSERRWPYIASILGAIIALIITMIFDGPELLRCLAIFSLIELTLLAIITNYWLISIHAASIAAATIIVGLVFGVQTAVFLLPLVILVSWVRLYLRRHTPAQVFAGLALGIVAVFAVTIIGCFV